MDSGIEGSEWITEWRADPFFPHDWTWLSALRKEAVRFVQSYIKTWDYMAIAFRWIGWKAPGVHWYVSGFSRDLYSPTALLWESSIHCAEVQTASAKYIYPFFKKTEWKGCLLETVNQGAVLKKWRGRYPSPSAFAHSGLIAVYIYKMANICARAPPAGERLSFPAPDKRLCADILFMVLWVLLRVTVWITGAWRWEQPLKRKLKIEKLIFGFKIRQKKLKDFKQLLGPCGTL